MFLPFVIGNDGDQDDAAECEQDDLQVRHGCTATRLAAILIDPLKLMMPLFR
jgi:hypothetical protein